MSLLAALQPQNIRGFNFLLGNWWLFTLAAIVLLGLIVLYYTLQVRAILQMLRLDVNKVLLTFAFLSLVILPPTLLLGIFILIIWHFHENPTSSKIEIPTRLGLKALRERQFCRVRYNSRSFRNCTIAP